MRIFLIISMLLLLMGCATKHYSEDDDALVLADGSTYNGVIKDGLPNGIGQTKTHDGAIYIGDHLNGEFHGEGKLMLSDGSYFIGNMNHNKVSHGMMYFKDGRTIPIYPDP